MEPHRGTLKIRSTQPMIRHPVLNGNTFYHKNNFESLSLSLCTYIHQCRSTSVLPLQFKYLHFFELELVLFLQCFYLLGTYVPIAVFILAFSDINVSYSGVVSFCFCLIVFSLSIRLQVLQYFVEFCFVFCLKNSNDTY